MRGPPKGKGLAPGEPFAGPSTNRVLIETGREHGVRNPHAPAEHLRRSSHAGELERFRREKVRRLERENEHLRRHRAQLERLLARALQLVTSGTGTTPTVLLGVLEEVDQHVHESLADMVVRVLRETA